MPAFEFIFRKAGEAFNFTKDRLCLSVPLRILKIFTAYISCTPAASYFFHYVIPWSFLLDTIVFSLYLFRWRYWEIISDRLINNICLWSSAISNFSCKHKLHLFELYIFLKNFICFYYYYYYYYYFFELYMFEKYIFWKQSDTRKSVFRRDFLLKRETSTPCTACLKKDTISLYTYRQLVIFRLQIVMHAYMKLRVPDNYNLVL